MERAAYFAGQWYPKDALECQNQILSHAADTKPGQGTFGGVIAPHAGWLYSGDAAAKSYRWLAESRPEADLVVIFGSHRGPNGPHSIFLEEGWQTPLGTLQNDQELARRLATELELKEE
ncbi:AmmeMemoRadiSam system protein B, partial [Myxococcota bacterium]|nr:AmmeMemoRadiSam system protein B [Myxococcota bacterium]